VKEHINAEGSDVIVRREAKIAEGEKDTNQDPTVIKELLALHDKHSSLVNNQFANHSLLQKALKEAFSEFVNKDVGKFKTADLMSNFCDRILKTGGEKLSDNEIDEYLSKVVQLFSYLTDKDLFAEMYRQQLAKRLLNQVSAITVNNHSKVCE
jgi:cullin 1